MLAARCSPFLGPVVAEMKRPAGRENVVRQLQLRSCVVVVPCRQRIMSLEELVHEKRSNIRAVVRAARVKGRAPRIARLVVKIDAGN